MSAHFWLWLFGVLVILGYGYSGWGARAANAYWYGPWIVFALWVFIVCFSIAGNPFSVLVH